MKFNANAVSTLYFKVSVKKRPYSNEEISLLISASDFTKTNDKGFPDVNLNVEYMEDFLKQKVNIIPKTSIWYFTLPKN